MYVCGGRVSSSVGSILQLGKLGLSSSSGLEIMPKRPIAPGTERVSSNLVFDLETVMHRLYHLTICKARIPKVLREYTIVGGRQEREEDQLCEIVGQHLKRGIPAETVAAMLDHSPLLNEAGKNVYREWVDVACLRADEPLLTTRRREETKDVGCKHA